MVKQMIVDWNVEKWEKFRDDFADISCWFMGFNAAAKDVQIPPGLRDFEFVMQEISRAIRETKNDHLA